MPNISKTAVDADLRSKVFDMIARGETKDFIKINDRSKGILITDLNGHTRYCRIGIIVATERTDMTAEELMQSEIDEYNATQAKKEAAEAARAKKAARDKKAREEAAAAKKAKEIEKEE